MKRVVPLILVVLAVLAVGTPLATAQQIDLDQANAREEFRFGVQAFHAARFNDAIVAFTRALAYTPDDLRVREWLGRAYVRSGLEDAAMAEWQILVDQQAAGAYLISRLDTMRYRRGVMPFADEDLRLSRSQVLEGQRGDARLFQRPAGVEAEPGGDIFVTSLGTQEILRITPNGRVRQRLRGGLEGLDQPFDVVRHGDTLYVSEFGGDRIAVLSPNGDKQRSFGAPGLAPGNLLGPQYLAMDADGAFVYVSEWGNRRVSKFAADGEFLLTIGAPSTFFRGLQRPTGVAVADGLVYVADVDDEGVALQVFDGSGNHIRRIPLPLSAEDAAENSISGAVVEDLAWYDDSRLLVAAGDRVLLFDPANEAVESVIDDAERVRVSSVVRDANSRVIVSDFDADQVGIFEPEGALYSGLDVRIERIIARNYPQVAMQVAVHDRDGRPLVGLTAENFVVSENGVPRPEISLDSTGQSVERVEASVLLQPRPGDAYADDAGRAVSDLVSALQPEDAVSLFAAGEDTQRLLSAPASSERFRGVSRDAVVERDGLYADDRIRLDRAIRTAVTPLMDGGLRRDLVVVGDGTVGDSAFTEYGVEEIASFLVNNGVRLHLVLLEQRTPAAELSYLVEETGGETRYLYEPEGIAPMVRGFRTAPVGRYWIVMNAQTDPDFGRRYIGVSVEARLFVRSGRDELGFFGPAAP